MNKLHFSASCAAALFLAASVPGDSVKSIPNDFPFPNDAGVLETHNTNGHGPIDLTGPFFQSLGTNGRSCGTCHKPDQAWSISAAGAKKAFDQSGGNDPMFRTNDGSNCDHN